MDDPLDAIAAPVFPAAQAVAAGLRTSRARRHDLVAVSRGLRRRRDREPAPVEVAVAHAQRDRSLVVSHASAAAVWGMWLPSEVERTPHLSRARPAAQPRMAAVRGHRLRLDVETDVVTVGAGEAAFSLTSPVRTWLDLAADGLRGEDLVIAGDALLRRADGPRGGLPKGWSHPLGTPELLRASLTGLRGVRGGEASREAAGRVRPRSDSPQETRLRLRIVAAGLPEPAVNPDVVLLRDYVGRVLDSMPVDLYYAQEGVAIQYEGEHHFAGPAQVRRDMRRDERLREAGNEVIRVDRAVFAAGEWTRFTDRLTRVLAARAAR